MIHLKRKKKAAAVEADLRSDCCFSMKLEVNVHMKESVCASKSREAKNALRMKMPIQTTECVHECKPVCAFCVCACQGVHMS